MKRNFILKDEIEVIGGFEIADIAKCLEILPQTEQEARVYTKADEKLEVEEVFIHHNSSPQKEWYTVYFCIDDKKAYESRNFEIEVTNAESAMKLAKFVAGLIGQDEIGIDFIKHDKYIDPAIGFDI